MTNPPTGPGNISVFSISGQGGAMDISAGVAEFRYYESILSNTITATATVIDTGSNGGNVVDALPIRGGERSQISVSDSKGNALQLPNGMYVNRVRNSDPTTTRDFYFIDFASQEFFSNDLVRVVKRYEGKISEHVSSILSEVLSATSQIDVESSSIPYNFYGNDRKPLYVCTWLASKAAPSSGGSSGGSSVGGTAGFLFYQTRMGLHFKSVDTLLSQGATKRFINTRSTETASGYDGNILSTYIDSNIDLGNNLTLGAYNNRTIFYDPVSFDYRVVNVGGQQSSMSNAGGSSAAMMVNQEFTQSPSRLMSAVLDVGYNPNGRTGQAQLQNWNSDKTRPNFDAPNIMVQSVMRYNQLFTIQTQVTIAGDFTIKAGDVVQCDFPNTQGGGGGLNNQSSGKYLVAHVCHKVTPQDSFTSLGLVRDSYGR